jgi:hypothetical protein
MAAQPRQKGVYTLNPTGAVMQPGSRAARRAVTSNVPGFKKVTAPKPKGKKK